VAGRNEQWPQAVLAPWAWHPEPGRVARWRDTMRAGDGGILASRALVVSVVLSVVFVAIGLVGWTSGAFSSADANAGNSFEAAATFGCTPGDATVVATADAWVYELNPTQNGGTDMFLAIQSKKNEDVRTLVNFSLPAIPTGCSMTAATLSLNAISASGTRTIEAFQAASAWTETGVTWSNQPLTTGTAATSSSGLGVRTWSVTTQVQAMYAGSNNGFLLRDSVEDTNGSGFVQAYNSRESSSGRPTLTVAYA
jgi:hypothetical protein